MLTWRPSWHCGRSPLNPIIDTWHFYMPAILLLAMSGLHWMDEGA